MLLLIFVNFKLVPGQTNALLQISLFFFILVQPYNPDEIYFRSDSQIVFDAIKFLFHNFLKRIMVCYFQNGNYLFHELSYHNRLKNLKFNLLTCG